MKKRIMIIVSVLAITLLIGSISMAKEKGATMYSQSWSTVIDDATERFVDETRMGSEA